MPIEAENLIQTAKLRLQCKTIGVDAITCGTQFITIKFSKDAKINVDTLLSMIQTEAKMYRLKNNQTLQVRTLPDKALRLSQIKHTLLKLKSK